MKWRGQSQSSNVTRSGSGGGFSGRGGGMAPIGGFGLILILLISFLTGSNPLDMIAGSQVETRSPNAQVQESALDKERGDFLAVVLKYTEDVWGEVFKSHGKVYREPTLNIYDGSVRTACGIGSSQTGPFYCPADETVYMDVSFYDDLTTKFDAPGDFAFAYVLAHEVGHHVQKQLGITDQVFSYQGKISEAEYNQLMVRMELQADYFAGVFAKYIQGKGYLEEGDIEEAMNAAAGVGDDRIQEKSLGRVIPDKFTHGTSEQRARWFKRGLEYGDINHGDTFSQKSL